MSKTYRVIEADPVSGKVVLEPLSDHPLWQPKLPEWFFSLESGQIESREGRVVQHPSVDDVIQAEYLGPLVRQQDDRQTAHRSDSVEAQENDKHGRVGCTYRPGSE